MNVVLCATKSYSALSYIIYYILVRYCRCLGPGNGRDGTTSLDYNSDTRPGLQDRDRSGV